MNKPPYDTSIDKTTTKSPPDSRNEQADKHKGSKGSLLFSQMQILTNKIKLIDNVQEKFIHEKIQRSREGSVTSKKDQIHNHSPYQTPIERSLPKEYQCDGCRTRDQEIKQLMNSSRKLHSQVESQQKEVTYLSFQLDLLKEQNKTKPKQATDSYKLFLRKSLEKFMSEVVLAKLSRIDKAISTLNKKIQKISSQCTRQNLSSSSQKKEQGKSIEHGGIKTQGQTQLPTSSTINLRKRSASKQGETNTESLRLRELEVKIKDKNTAIFQLEKELVNVKKKNIETMSQYETRLQNLRKLNTDKQSVYSRNSIATQPDSIARVKQLEQKLSISEKQYRKLNQRYLAIQKKEEQLNLELENHRLKVLAFQRGRDKFESMEKEMLLQTRELESVRIQLKEEKDTNSSNFLIINRLKEKLQQMQFELSIKQEEETSQDTQLDKLDKPKSNNFEKQFKIFQESNNRLKAQTKRLNENLHNKSKELEMVHDQYRTQLYEKERKLYQLEMMMKEDFSKIRQSKDSDFRISRQSDNSLMFSTTRINTTKDIDFILSEGEIILPEFPNIEQLFATKDFSNVQLDSHYDQQEFLKKVSDYIDTIRLSASRSKSKTRSRGSSEQKQKDDKKSSSELKTLVHNILTQINRISKEVPEQIKTQFFKLKSLLDRFKEQLNSIQSNTHLLGELKDLSILLVRATSKDKNSKQTDQIIKMMKNLLRMSTL